MTRLASQQTSMWVHCRRCRTEWEVRLPLPMPLDRAIRVIRGATATGCPTCGAHGPDVLCGQTPETTKDEVPA